MGTGWLNPTAGIDFTVIGLLEKQGSQMGRTLDNPVYIPVTMFYSLYGGRQRGSQVFGRARDGSGLTMDDALDTTRAGSLAVSVRATSRSGATQPEKLVFNPSGYHHNIIQTVLLEVA